MGMATTVPGFYGFSSYMYSVYDGSSLVISNNQMRYLMDDILKT